MDAKFGIRFMTTDDIEFMRDHAGFWKNRFIIASINTAKSSKNMPAVTEQFYDLLIDEKKIIFTQYLKSMDYIEDLLFLIRN